MKIIFCVISLSAIAICLALVPAWTDPRLEKCYSRMAKCAKLMVTKLRYADVTGLCNATPLETTTTKCMMDCLIVQYKILNDDGFQKDQYLEFIKITEVARRRSFREIDATIEAAGKVVDICKDVKASFDDRCETAYLILKCLQDEGNKLKKFNLGYALFYVDPNYREPYPK